MVDQQQATHFAVPINVFQSAVKMLSALPFEQVSELMAALQQCRPLAMPQNARPGDMVGQAPPPQPPQPDLKAVEDGKE